MKKHYAYIILLCCAALFAAGCSWTCDEEPVLPMPVTANLDISVAFSGRAADGYSITPAPEGDYDDEYMKCLRIIIVRPDGTVEHNRLLSFENNFVKKVGDVDFRVVANEKKKIYLFANEGFTKVKNKEPDNGTSELKTYDFSTIEAGKPFPAKELAEYKFTLGGATEELAGPLPMSECHSVWVPEQEDYACNLFITRAAVKFSFVFDNQSGEKRTLAGLEINKLLRTEYYLPRNAVYGEPDADGVRDIISFEVPSWEDSNNGYYTFKRYFGENIDLPTDKEIALPPIYLLEGKYADDAGTDGENGRRNYSTRIQLAELPDMWLEWQYFPNLTRLPRNTHVKVTAVIGKESTIAWTVEILPYTEAVLKPVFGLDEEEPEP